jgi:tRNA pseudouridine38-40 synthase
VDLLEEPPLLLIRVVGSHFLWRMVRRMIGVLVAVGRRELRPSDVPRMLDEASGESAALAAPAAGLFLERVYYPGDDRAGEPCKPRGQNGTRSGRSGCAVPPFASS